MQNVLRTISLGIAIAAIPFFASATGATGNELNALPKEATKLIAKTKTLTLTEAAQVDFSGTYTGKRYQYNASHTDLLRTYTYTMTIVQKATQITGTTRIEADNGDYAIIELRGMVLGNKMYFEEYAIREQQKTDGMVWCFKVGELELGKNKGNTIVFGTTNSYTSVYYLPCTGGYTVLEKEGVQINNSLDKLANPEIGIPTKMDVNVYPNPFLSQVQVAYTLDKDSKVSIELYDINGRLINTVYNGQQTSGSQNISIDGSRLSNGVYIVKLTIDGVITSKQVIKSIAN